jgi:hypothetical protein
VPLTQLDLVERFAIVVSLRSTWGRGDAEFGDVDRFAQLREAVELAVDLEKVALRRVHLEADDLIVHTGLLEVAQIAEHLAGRAAEFAGVVPTEGHVLPPGLAVVDDAHRLRIGLACGLRGEAGHLCELLLAVAQFVRPVVRLVDDVPRLDPVTLGRFFSPLVTIREDHRVIRDGPYLCSGETVPHYRRQQEVKPKLGPYLTDPR